MRQKTAIDNPESPSHPPVTHQGAILVEESLEIWDFESRDACPNRQEHGDRIGRMEAHERIDHLGRARCRLGQMVAQGKSGPALFTAELLHVLCV